MLNLLTVNFCPNSPSSDSWSKIGEMLDQRMYQEVVEVPGEWCDIIDPVDQTPTTEDPDKGNGAGAVVVNIGVVLGMAVVMLTSV